MYEIIYAVHFFVINSLVVTLITVVLFEILNKYDVFDIYDEKRIINEQLQLWQTILCVLFKVLLWFYWVVIEIWGVDRFLEMLNIKPYKAALDIK